MSNILKAENNCRDTYDVTRFVEILSQSSEILVMDDKESAIFNRKRENNDKIKEILEKLKSKGDSFYRMATEFVNSDEVAYGHIVEKDNNKFYVVFKIYIQKMVLE